MLAVKAAALLAVGWVGAPSVAVSTSWPRQPGPTCAPSEPTCAAPGYQAGGAHGRVARQAPALVQLKATATRGGLRAASNEQPPPSPDGATFVQRHGRLRTEGGRVVDQAGQPVMLQGMSLFWSQWMPQFWNAGTVHWLASDWKISLIRAAMAVENEGYLENPRVEQARLEVIVDAAIADGIYVIVDWHDHNADQHPQRAVAFFTEMAQKYGSYPNVLFEVFNEPVEQAWDSVIKPYHDEVVRAIRQHSSNLIICGTGHWSQDVDVAADLPVSGDNLAYTIHFYAASHKGALRRKAEYAISKGAALFATEWGTCEASGDGELDFAETATWLSFFESHGISHANWAIGDKEEACSALRPGAAGAGGWGSTGLTLSGLWVRAWLRGLRGAALPVAVPEMPAGADLGSGNGPQGGGPQCAATGEDCHESRCCQAAGMTCYEKNTYWAGCRQACQPGLHMDDPEDYRSPWTCRILDLVTE